MTFALADRSDAVHDRLARGRVAGAECGGPGGVRACRAGDGCRAASGRRSSPRADYYESLRANNFDGTYNIFQAAADAGCERVVFASSVQTVLGYPKDDETPIDASWWPMNMYAVSKCYGEATARMFAATTELSAICVRIGAYERPELSKPEWQHELSAYVSPRDLNQLFRLCIDAEGIDFAVVHGISNNRVKRLSLVGDAGVVGVRAGG